jgi:hypothetical protein
MIRQDQQPARSVYFDVKKTNLPIWAEHQQPRGPAGCEVAGIHDIQNAQ